jgi:hypothetical protein
MAMQMSIRARMADFRVITLDEVQKLKTIVQPKIQEVFELLDTIAKTFAQQNNLDPDNKKVHCTAPMPRDFAAQVAVFTNFISFY